MEFRQARGGDLDRVVETITSAFAADPVWSVALARDDGASDHHPPYWRFFVESAHGQDGVWLADGGAAVSVWIPPGGSELSAESTLVLDAFIERWLGPAGAAEMQALYDRFDSNHPRTEPHAYLSLLATHPDDRGRGVGQALLADDLRRWDALAIPAYLESTNPGNDHRYERAGFRRVGEFRAIRDEAPISTMWRPAGGPG